MPRPCINLATAAAILTAAMCSSIATSSYHHHPQQHFDCPLPQHLSPCTCTERDRGLDITCSDINFIQLREVVDVITITRQTIWFLRLAKAELQYFPKNLFDGLDVRNLVAVQCNISEMDHLAFTGDTSRMESLDLSRNFFKDVPSKALSALTSLAALNMDYNFIEVLERNAFSGLVSLLWLSLYGNRIQIIDSKAFLGTEASLTRLNLGGNRLEQVPRYPLHRLNCLQGLRLHDNNISEVVLEFLPPSLCELDLSGNEISKIESSSFAALPHLSSLDLEDNRIRTIDINAFYGIEDSLEWLKLGANEIASIPSPSFRNLTRLRQLDLRCNMITTVDQDSFLPFGSTLKFIFLQKNSIQRIDELAMEPLVSVEWLYLHSNALTSVPHSTFKSIVDRLHVLDLHDNPFHCDCDILWFRDWLHGKGANVANLPKETRCKTPSKYAQQSIDKLSNTSFVCSTAADVMMKWTNYVFSFIFLLMTPVFLRF